MSRTTKGNYTFRVDDRTYVFRRAVTGYATFNVTWLWAGGGGVAKGMKRG